MQIFDWDSEFTQKRNENEENQTQENNFPQLQPPRQFDPIHSRQGPNESEEIPNGDIVVRQSALTTGTSWRQASVVPISQRRPGQTDFGQRGSNRIHPPFIANRSCGAHQTLPLALPRDNSPSAE
jgi:hypothetical protein